MTDRLPKISIVTPSLNQSQFIENAIISVINQNYNNLEYVIIDGGSKDGSVDIIRKYETQLKFWKSEEDNGQFDAINKGFEETTGEIMAWLNSDDIYTPWVFSIVSEVFSTFPEIEWITTLYPLVFDKSGRAIECSYRYGYSRQGFFRGEHLTCKEWYSNDWIQQESTFWRRSLWERSGGHVDSSLEFAGDFELWARFYKFSELYGVAIPLGGFRRHKNQKTASFMDNYVQEAQKTFFKYGGRPYGRVESYLRLKLQRALPSRFRPIAYKLGLLYPWRHCSHENGDWKLRIV